jgi:hypothetical protein
VYPQVDDSKDPSLLNAVKEAVAHDYKDLRENGHDDKIHILGISVWGNFVPALNSLLTFAVQKGYDLILYASPEVDVTAEAVDCLQFSMTPGMVSETIMHRCVCELGAPGRARSAR